MKIVNVEIKNHIDVFTNSTRHLIKVNFNNGQWCSVEYGNDIDYREFSVMLKLLDKNIIDFCEKT